MKLSARPCSADASWGGHVERAGKDATPQPFGRKPVLDAGERRKIAERFASGETMAELAREYDVGVATIHRTVHGL